jgi:hypothetical protein
MRGKKHLRANADAVFGAETAFMTPEFESACQLSSSLLRALVTVVNDFRVSIEKIPTQSKTHAEMASQLQKQTIMGMREVLQRCVDLVSTLKIKSEDQTAFDHMLIPVNALAMTGLNLKAKYNEAAEAEKANTIKTSIDLISNNLKSLVQELRLLVATQLGQLLLAAKAGRMKLDEAPSLKLAKAVKVIATLQRHLLDSSASNVIMKGFLLKRTKNQKNWKKYWFALHEDKLEYSEKENVSSLARVRWL